MDLANSLVVALKETGRNLGVGIYNMGTGHSYSVLDMVNAFVSVNGVEVQYSIKPRRAGDIASCYCGPAKAKTALSWKTQYSTEEIVRDSLNWQKERTRRGINEVYNI